MFNKLYELLNCRNDQSLTNQFSSLLKSIGVQSFAYIKLTHHQNVEPKVISSYPVNWIEKYCKNNYQNIDPTVLLSRNLSKPFSWQLGRKLPSEQIAEYWEEAAGYKLNYGVSIPLDSGMLHSSGIGLSLDVIDDTDWLKEHRDYITTLCHIFHYKLSLLESCPQHNIKKFGLSNREIECAHWLCSGFSLLSIAEKMSITERTVRFHLNQLKNKLACKNKEQVVAKLISMKIVKI